MQKISQIEVERGREFLQILAKIDLMLGKIGYKVGIGLAVVFIIGGFIIVEIKK